MTKAKSLKSAAENLLQGLSISKVIGNEPHYKTYAINLSENQFTIRKQNNFIWVSNDVIEQHGNDIVNCIGCYIDDNSI